MTFIRLKRLSERLKGKATTSTNLSTIAKLPSLNHPPKDAVLKTLVNASGSSELASMLAVTELAFLTIIYAELILLHFDPNHSKSDKLASSHRISLDLRKQLKCVVFETRRMTKYGAKGI